MFVATEKDLTWQGIGCKAHTSNGIASTMINNGVMLP